MKTIVFALLLLCSNIITAQNFWSAPNNAAIIKEAIFKHAAAAKDYKLYNLNKAALHNQLFKIVDAAPQSTTIITLPNAAGTMEQFEMKESSNFEPALQARYPQIRCFSGKGITDATATVTLSISPEGIEAFLLRTGKPVEIMQSCSKDNNTYAVYTSSLPALLPAFKCGTTDKLVPASLKQPTAAGLPDKLNDQIITLRIIVSTGYQYSQKFGGIGLIWPQVNLAFAYVNTIFERDLGVHFHVMYESEKLFFFKKSDDPYSKYYDMVKSETKGVVKNPDIEILGKLAATVFAKGIKPGQYDLMHLLLHQPLKTGTSGIGSTGNPLSTHPLGTVGFSSQNRKIDPKNDESEYQSPRGEEYYMALAHELGHQVGATHTGSHERREDMEQNDIPVEPGSGATIMSYAGNKGLLDIRTKRIPYFHSSSITQVKRVLTKFLEENKANTPTVLKNAIPQARVSTYNNQDAVSAVFNIPKNTPFILKGYATKGNTNIIMESNDITYSWEQTDEATGTFWQQTDMNELGGNSGADPDKRNGPNFISLAPATAVFRNFPQLETILKGEFETGADKELGAHIKSEALSNVARDLNFDLTVRDNTKFDAQSLTGPHLTKAFAKVTVAANTDTFKVTSPNIIVEWPEDSKQKVTWKVGNTKAAPVNCALVNILLSIDGGNNWVALAKDIENEGTADIIVPTGTATNYARIKVEASNNIFFDICDKDFKIIVGCPIPIKQKVKIFAYTKRDESNPLVFHQQIRFGLDNPQTRQSFIMPYNAGYMYAGTVADIDLKNTAGQYVKEVRGLTEPYYTFSNVSPKTYSYRIRIRCKSQPDNENEGMWTEDQFTVSKCGMIPVPLPATKITATTATLPWDYKNGDDRFTVQYKKSTDEKNWTQVDIGEPGYIPLFANLTGLEQGTSYDWKVRSVCRKALNSSDYSDYSDYSEIKQFSTPTCNLEVEDLRQFTRWNEGKLFWKKTPGAKTYQVDFFKTKTFNSGWQTLADDITEPFTGINDWWYDRGKETIWRVRAKCDNGAYSEWTYHNFSGPSCNVVPKALPATEVKGNSAVLNWDTIPGAWGYWVQYRETTDKEWITVPTTIVGNSYSLSQLKTAASYDWQVKTICGATNHFSDYSTMQQFTTQGCDKQVGGLSAITNSYSGRLIWEGDLGTSGYDIDFEINGGDWSGAVFKRNNGTESVPITNKWYEINRLYQWRVRAICPNGGAGQWVSAVFSPPSCPAPIKASLNVTYNDANNVTVYWKKVEGLTGKYVISYTSVGGTQVQQLKVDYSASSAKLPNLKPNTTYTWDIRSECDGADSYTIIGKADGPIFTTCQEK